MISVSDRFKWGSRNTLWSRIWCKVVLGSRNIPTVISYYNYILFDLSIYPVVLFRDLIDLAASRTRSIKNGWPLSEISDSRNFCLWLPAMCYEVSPDSNSSDASGCVFSTPTNFPCWDNIFADLCPGPWIPRKFTRRFHIIMVIIVDAGTLCQLLREVQEHLERAFDRIVSVCNS